MGRTWLLRGCALAVFAVLGGAWATGVVALGDTPPPATKHTAPETSHRPDAVRFQHGSVLERAKVRRAHEAKPSQAAVVEPTPSSTGEPTDGAPSTSGTPSPSDPGQGHTHSGPSGGGGGPGTPHPTDPGTPPPSQPSQDCTQLSDVLNCVLAPITSHP
jgi:hypothetical protein